MVGRATWCAAAALFAMASAGEAQAECSRDTLVKLTSDYVAAQTDGTPGTMPMAAEAYYGENNMPVAISAGMLSHALPVDFTRSFHDTAQCATFTELVSATSAHPYVIHTRMEADNEGKVKVMESVITDADDWVFGADAHLGYTRAENWGPIAPGRRDTREAIKAAADAYLDNWADPDLPVPHGTPCTRLEGRVYTGAEDPAAQSCTMGAFPVPIHVTNRRYVIDETVGAVSVFHDFPWLDAGLSPYSPGTQASQIFRVENGMNRYIHEVTVCATPGCSRSRPGGG